MQTTVILAAAGPGTRLGAAKPKAFVPLHGVPLFVHTLRSLLAAAEISAVIVVVPPGEQARAKEWLDRLGPWRCPIRLVPGGSERQDSVRLGLQAVDTELVAIHDAARPFVDGAIVTRAIDIASEQGACIVATPATDTLKQVDSTNRIVTTVPRAGVWCAQTPQVFRTAILREAHAAARGADVVETDDSALVERLGHRVRIVAGNPENRKITTAADLRWAEWLLEHRAPH